MTSRSWNVPVPCVDNNDGCDRGPPSMFLRHFPTLPASEPSRPPYLSSNTPIFLDQHMNYSSQPPSPRPIVNRTVYQPAQTTPPMLWGTNHQQVLLDPQDTTMKTGQVVEYAGPYLSATVPEQQHEAVSAGKKIARTSAACENCRYMKAKCDEKTPCITCQIKNIVCKRREINLPKKYEAEILDKLDKTLKVVLDVKAKVDRMQRAERISSGSPPDSSMPVHTSTENSSCLPDRPANESTEEPKQPLFESDPDSDSEDRSTLPSTPAFARELQTIPVEAKYGHTLREVGDVAEDEWESQRIWFYISNFMEASEYSAVLSPPNRDDAVEKLLAKASHDRRSKELDSSCQTESFKLEIDDAVVLFMLAIGKFQATRVSSYQDLKKSPGLGYFVLAHGFIQNNPPRTTIPSGANLQYVRAYALGGIYTDMLRFYAKNWAHITKISLGYFSKASQLMRSLFFSNIESILCEHSCDNDTLLELYLLCLRLESRIPIELQTSGLGS
ncbi:hypothetical protein HD806DRAFT_532310 [Xylariaceae sp. AK1471]|nr:hypothetical protein HD806DRAFT_532310 [Xylariaceae sp. AK1471]